jgi:hypothetical protein
MDNLSLAIFRGQSIMDPIIIRTFTLKVLNIPYYHHIITKCDKLPIEGFKHSLVKSSNYHIIITKLKK